MPPFLLLMQPGTRGQLWENRADAGQIVLGASFLGQPVGAAVAYRGADAAQLLDLYVLPSYRQVGIGRALLAAVEEQIRLTETPRMQTLYRSNAQTPYFQRLLTGQGWTAPLLKNRIFWTRCAVAFGPWVSRYHFRPPYTLFAWPELTADERKYLLAEQETGWFPPLLSPFHRPDDAWDAESSIGLRYNGEVVGWCLTVREKPEQMLVDVLFVDPPLQRLGRGFMLVGEVIRRYCASGGDYAYWRVSPENEPMLRWSAKAFAGEGLLDEYEEWYSEKVLLL